MDPTITQTLDAELKYLLPKIHSHPTLAELSKQLKIRISSWLSKLESIMSNNMWRKNRNNYLKLLYIMLEWKEIIEPFTNMPPDEIPTLQKSFINSILLKLTTKAKETFRGSETKLQKLTPEEIWGNFDNKPTLKNTDSSATFKTYTNNSSHDHISKANKFEEIDLEYLSPISQNNLHVNSHSRFNSTLSAITYSSIEKRRDLINDPVIEHKTQEKENKDPTTKVNLRISQKETVNKEQKKKSESFSDSEISYFRKNRESNYLSEEEFKPLLSCFNVLKSQEFYHKVFTFLKKHELELEEDTEYSEVMEGLKDYLSALTETKCDGLKNNKNYFSETPQTFASMFRQPSSHFNKNSYQDEIPEMEESNTFDNNNGEEESYNYGYGKFSEFSEIEVDEGISPSRILHINENTYDKHTKINNQIIENQPGSFKNLRRGISINKGNGQSRKRMENYGKV